MGKREKELFDYLEGKLFWKTPTSNRVKVGQEAGSLTTNGYKTVCYDGKCRMLHRVIWDWFYEQPCEGYLVDHKDKTPLNNDIENLRLCDHSLNAANSFRHKDGLTKYKGVHKHKNGSYRAQICVRGKRFSLGLYTTPEEAHQVYKKAASLAWQDFYYGGENRKA